MAAATVVKNEIPAQVLVENTRTCVSEIQLPSDIGKASRVISLPPGISAVVGSEWEEALANPLVQAWLSKGWLRVQEGKQGPVGSLSECDPIKACQIVYATLSLQVLRGWQAQETRKGVLEALAEQIAKLSTPGSEAQK